jgi:hypothetical protein
MWNYFSNEGRPRTNNSLESYNAKLKRFISFAQPNIYEALQSEEVASGAEYHRALQGQNPGPRRKLYVTKNDTYGTYKTLYQAGEITIERIVDLLVISKKKTVKEGVAAQNFSSSEESDEEYK